jgi:hypothetical protein
VANLGAAYGERRAESLAAFRLDYRELSELSADVLLEQLVL